MLIEKDYCDYDTCVALKELGYKVPTSDYYMPHHKDLIWVSNPFRGGYVTDCFYSHNSLPKDVMTANFIDASTLCEAQKWLREEKKIEVNAFWDRIAEKWYSYINFMYYPDLMGIEVMQSIYDSYEEALSESIKEAVKNLPIC